MSSWPAAKETRRHPSVRTCGLELMLVATPYRGIIVVALVTVVIWACGLLGVFGHAPGWLYDQFMRTTALATAGPPQVLVVEVGTQEAPLDESRWIRLLEILEGLGARQVVFMNVPDGVGSAFFDRVQQSGKIVIGRTARRQYFDVDDLTLESWPTALEEAQVPYGVVTLPRAELGIYRAGQDGVQVGEDWLPTLAVAAAKAAGVPESALPNMAYLINFNAGRDGLPRVSAARVLANGLIPELVAGRSVLIGMAPARNSPGMHAPNTYDAEPLSFLEFQGFALDTLLGEKPIRTLGPLSILALLLLTASVSLFIYQWLNVRPGGWFTLGALLVYWACAWLLLRYVWIWAPVFELSLTQLLLYMLVARLKLTLNEHALRKLIIASSSRFHGHANPASFYDAPEHWTHVITLVDQALQLTRLIFLEKLEGDHRVREVKALNCSVDDISERRRDYERTPYSTAIAEGGPIRLQKSYLTALEGRDEEQYLVPLTFAGEVLGFWAFGAAPQTVRTTKRFRETVHVFANQISEMLYHRRRWREQQETRAQVLRRFLRLEGGNLAYPQVRRFLELAQRRVTGMAAVFNGLDTAAIVYDLFGQVLHLNRRMEEFMRTTNLPGYELTSLDLLTRITGIDRPRARELLRDVILENGQFRLPVSGLQGPDGNFLVGVRAVSCADSPDGETDRSAPFEIFGLLFELIDVGQLQGMHALKEAFVERLGSRLRQELAAIVLGSDLVQEHAVAAQDKERAAQILQDKVSDTVELFAKARRYMQVKVDGPGLGLYPVDATEAVVSAVRALSEQAQDRGIRFSAELPEFASLVRAQPLDLAKLMYALLETLVNDAAENSAIEIDVEEREGCVMYQFRNTGFGVPNDRFQTYLFGTSDTVAQEFRTLHDAIKPVGDWEGRIAASSGVGTGMAFNVELRVAI